MSVEKTSYFGRQWPPRTCLGRSSNGHCGAIPSKTSSMTASTQPETAAIDEDGDVVTSVTKATRPLRAGPITDVFTPVEPPVLNPGTTVGRYLVLEDLARGGMSLVYVAYDPKLDRRVALKLMRPDYSERPDKAQARLLREAQAMAQITHPNVVRIYDVGVLDERVYMAMELVEGQTLRDWNAQRTRGWRTIVDVLVRAGRGLAAAHEAGLVHLDVKPRNIMVGDDGEVRVVDFGLARTSQRAEWASDADEEPAQPVGDGVTHAGVVMGTPGYMSPEQLSGCPPDARSDQFSFCITAWEALYGQRPFGGRELDNYSRALSAGVVDPPSDHQVPARIRRLLERGLELKPTERYPSLGELLDAMMVDRRQIGYLSAAFAGLAAVVATGTWALAGAPLDPCADQAQRLDGVWDSERREQVHARLTELDAQRPRPMADALVERLDDYATAWTEAATDSCRAAKSTGLESSEFADVRGYCLELRRGQLQASVDLLLDSETMPDDRWDRVVTLLPAVDRCRDVTSIYEVGRPPADDALRESVLEIDRGLARAWARVRAGRLTAAMEEATAAATAAEVTEYRPIIAKARQIQAATLSLLERREEAEQIGFEAAWMADVEGMHRVRLEALTDLVYNVGVLGGRAEEAEHLGQNALWVEEHLVSDPELRSRVLSHLGAVDTSSGRYARARERFEQSIELLRLHDHFDDALNVTSTLVGMGAVEFQLGNGERALELFQDARRMASAHNGPDHPATLMAAENEATALHALERYEEALDVLEHIRAVPGRPSAVTNDATLGAVYADLGRYAEAQQALERVVPVLERDQVRPLLLAITYGNLAVATLEQDDAEAARTHAERSRAILETQLGTEHPYGAWVLGLQARAELDVGMALKGLEHAGMARAIVDAADQRADTTIEPEFRAEASLALARALSDPKVQDDPEAVKQWGAGRTARAWAEQALAEAKAGDRAAASVRRRAEQWLESTNQGG